METALCSVWSETTAREIRPALEENINVDVLVVGGGICGVLVAYWLKKAGVRCIVAEAKEIGGGVTKNTTAKITAQHGLIYGDLIKRFGKEKARQYYEANSHAIRRYHELAEQFPCDFEYKTAYVYSVNDRRKLEREADACRMLGIKTHLHESIPLPVKTKGGLAMEGQVQFHPLKLLYALANELEIYERTFVVKVVGQTAITSRGKITAKHIVLATHYPLVNIPGLYFMKLYQHRSYVIAMEGASMPDGMYLDEHEEGYSFRTYGDLLFVGGGDHKTSKKGGGYAAIQTLVKQAYPHAIEKYRWATQDCMSLDKIPYIGKHKAGSENLYTATGFNKWGMSGSMVVAEILTDLIASGKSRWEDVFTPQRSMMTRQLMVNMGSAAKGLLSVGAPRCTHMGCKLHWNTIEKSWDCACHGSRFEKNGHVINNPAKKEIRL
ncbi:MAG: FAD-dependent oxidoreductase [Defluviitaleaceae bacterium]|nr:FAD-dependent oxidoreductase [Defluviitaleaceae bacterium]